MFSFVRNHQPVFQSGCTILRSTSSDESSRCSTSSPAFCVVSVLDLGHSRRCVVVFHCCLKLHPLMTYDVENCFICLSAICTSSSGRCLLMSLAYFLIELFVFLFLSLRDLCIFWIRVLLWDTSFANTFSQSMAYFLILLILSFAEQKFLILMKSGLWIIVFIMSIKDLVSDPSLPPLRTGTFFELHQIQGPSWYKTQAGPTIFRTAPARCNLMVSRSPLVTMQPFQTSNNPYLTSMLTSCSSNYHSW